MTSQRLSLGAFVAAMGLLAGAAQAGDLSVHEAWARATPPGAPTSASYMRIANGGDRDRQLVAARSAVAARVELHTVIEQDGLMKMRQVEGIAVPAGGEATLEPGGFHVMLIGLEQSLAEGDRLALELVFADGETLSVEAPVQKMAGKMKHGHMKHGEMDHSQMKHGE